MIVILNCNALLIGHIQSDSNTTTLNLLCKNLITKMVYNKSFGILEITFGVAWWFGKTSDVIRLFSPQN